MNVGGSGSLSKRPRLELQNPVRNCCPVDWGVPPVLALHNDHRKPGRSTHCCYHILTTILRGRKSIAFLARGRRLRDARSQKLNIVFGTKCDPGPPSHSFFLSSTCSTAPGFKSVDGILSRNDGCHAPPNRSRWALPDARKTPPRHVQEWFSRAPICRRNSAPAQHGRRNPFLLFGDVRRTA